MLRHSTSRQPRAAGFTLIELLAVIAIIGILMTFLVPRVVSSINRAKVTACKANMQEIWKHLVIYDQKFDTVPPKGGVAFLASLVDSGVMENTENNVRRLTCPAIEDTALSIGALPPEEWFADPELVDGSFSAYAARDMERHGLRHFPGSGKEVLVADDNDGGANHPDGTTVALMADGSLKEYEQYELRQEGILEEDELLIVGPDSQLEELRKLSLD